MKGWTPDGLRHGAVPAFACLGKSGVAEIKLLQQLEMQGGRYLVERLGKQGSVVAVEGGYDRIGAIDRIGRFQQQRPEVVCLRVASIVSILAADCRKQPLIG